MKMKIRKWLALLLTLATALTMCGMTVYAAKEVIWDDTLDNTLWSPVVINSAPGAPHLIELPEDKIKSTVESINNANSGDLIDVVMEQATVIPKEILEAAKGKNITITFKMDDYSWTVNGADIAAEDLKDINLQVIMGTNNIPDVIRQALAGKNAVEQITLAHDGEFGFKATLTINVGNEHTGKYGNLYYYNKSRKLEFIGSGKISVSGDLDLPFSHASDYMIVMSDQQMSQADVPQELDPTAEPNDSQKPSEPEDTINEGSGNKAPEKESSGNKTSEKKPTAEESKKNLTDSISGITVSGVEEGVELKVDSAVSQEQRTAIEEKVKKLIGDYKGIAIFDISLRKNNAEIQPGAPVKVTIPIPQGFSKNLKLYHQNAEGELEAVDISVGDSIVSFEAKSFSPYILVDLGEEAGGNNGTSKNTAPKTADTSSVIPYIMLAFAAVGSMGVLTRRKSKNC